MRRPVVLLLAGMLTTAAAALILGGCSAQLASSTVAVAAAPPAEGHATGVDRRLGEPVQQFGFELLAEVARDDSGSPATVVSPTSAAAALAMTLNGAEGETAEQLRQTMHVDTLEPDDVNEAWANTLAAFANGDKVQVATSLWADEGVAFHDEFLAADRDYFGAEIRTLDLQSPGAPAAMNKWVSDNTQGRITGLVQEIDPQAVLELLNTVYFKDRWANEFDPESTEDADFTLADGTDVQTPLMTRSGMMPYGERADGTQVVRLDYEGDQSMYVLLPPEDGSVAALTADLAENGMPEIGVLKSREGSLWLPRFEVRSRFSLADQLKALGITQAFDPNAAAFGRMADLPQLHISEVTHETYIKTDEEGTEAAAATAVEMGALSAPSMQPDPPFEMRVDRPFLFVLADDPSGVVLFVGVIRDPRSGQ